MNQPANVVDEYQKLVDSIKTKLSHSIVIILHAPHKDNTHRGSVYTALVSASLSDAYHDMDVVYINNKNVTALANDSIQMMVFTTHDLEY